MLSLRKKQKNPGKQDVADAAPFASFLLQLPPLHPRSHLKRMPALHLCLPSGMGYRTATDFACRCMQEGSLRLRSQSVQMDQVRS